jgi:hypothetical protein
MACVNKQSSKYCRNKLELQELYHATGEHVGWRLVTYQRYLTRRRSNLQHKMLQPQIVNTLNVWQDLLRKVLIVHNISKQILIINFKFT